MTGPASVKLLASKSKAKIEIRVITFIFLIFHLPIVIRIKKSIDDKFHLKLNQKLLEYIQNN